MLGIAKAVGKAGYHVMAKRRVTAMLNLKAVFGQRFDDRARRKLVRTIFKNLAINFMELLLVPRLDNQYFKTHVKVKGLDNVEEALKKRHGVIFLTGHYGNWEFASITAAVYGYKIYVLGRQQTPFFLNDIINKHRSLTGCIAINKGIAVRDMVRALKSNGLVGILGDQSGKQGKKMDFFGRNIFIADGAFRMAARTGAAVLPAFNTRNSIQDHQLIIERPILGGKPKITEAEIDQAMCKYRDLLEKYISKDPKQWMWINKRWKYTKARSVLLLNDSKAGHINQAQVVALEIEKKCPEYKKIEVDIAFKSPRHKILLTLLTLVMKCFIPEPLKIMRWALKTICYKELENTYCDIVICSGASTRALALLLAKENQAKAISVMKPVPFREDAFDLAIVPRHDKPAKAKNILITDGALNTLSQDYVKECIIKLRQHHNISQNGLKVGLLIGGDSKHYKMSVGCVEDVVKQLKRFSDEFNAQILISTSRRTPAAVDKYLRDSFDKHGRCVFSVYPNEKNYDYAVGAILGICNVVIVSGESISMVSEAATSPAYPIVFVPERLKQKTKHDLFLDNLQKSGFIRLTASDVVYGQLVNFKHNPVKLKKLEDTYKLAKAIESNILK